MDKIITMSGLTAYNNKIKDTYATKVELGEYTKTTDLNTYLNKQGYLKDVAVKQLCSTIYRHMITLQDGSSVIVHTTSKTKITTIAALIEACNIYSAKYVVNSTYYPIINISGSTTGTIIYLTTQDVGGTLAASIGTASVTSISDTVNKL